MADSKLEIKVGSITFSGEGSGEWLSTQLDKILAKIPELITLAPSDNQQTNGINNEEGEESGDSGSSKAKASGTLASYLKATSSTSSQVRKFLATAAWLHDSEGKERVTTKDVSSTLNRHNQGKLTNPSSILNQNVTKGYCVKDRNGFYVTPEGKASLSK